VNGTARELVYKERVRELPAHQVSTASGIALFALYFAVLERAWPMLTWIALGPAAVRLLRSR
jgi:hypothetical protein